MIHSLKIIDPGETPVSWLGNVSALKKPREFTFSPGLNILWGRNGSGKSTILKLLAMMLHCAQSGNPVVTSTSVEDLCERMRFKDQPKAKLENSVLLRHDGQGTRFFNPSAAVGLVGGGAAFDWDFGREGMLNVMFRGSAGQTTMQRFDSLLTDCLCNKPPPSVEYRVKETNFNDYWKEWFGVAKGFLKANAKKGPATILMDEPERSVDLPLQVQCWRLIRALVRRETQIIVASHSLFALNIPEANYVEMEPGYMVMARKCLALLPEWAEEQPRMPDSPSPEPAKKEAKKRSKR